MVARSTNVLKVRRFGYPSVFIQNLHNIKKHMEQEDSPDKRCISLIIAFLVL